MKISLIVTCFLLLFIKIVSSQSPPDEFHLLFYNVENLFDTHNDPETSDDEFTPGGSRHWTAKRLKRKLSLLSKVLLGTSGWIPPQLIALCETENRYVLEKLIADTPLKAYPYRIIHKESPDPRGIDVALLYNEEQFYPLQYQYIPVVNRENEPVQTREILYVEGILNKADTIHLFVNHWPSRYGGLLESRQSRNLAAGTLRHTVESLQDEYHHPKIIITGDFNDQPTDESLKAFLQATTPVAMPEPTTLYNLSYSWMKNDIQTLKHQSQWSVFDQFIVSGSMTDTTLSIYTTPGLATIVNTPWLLENDERFGHFRPYRTYYGFRYQGGFSDHLPVLLKIMTSP